MSSNAGGDHAAERAETNMSAEPRRHYLPAAGHAWALPFYDAFVALMGGNSAREPLVEQAALRPGQRVLDLGCGTGTLLVHLKRRHPEVEVVGLDPDPMALARARRKAERAGVAVQLDEGFSDALPYPAASFDRVLSSFMLHHLEAAEKGRTLEEIKRVLRPGGTLHLLDFGGEESPGHGVLIGRLHRNHRLHDNFAGGIRNLMHDAGFADARQVKRGALLLGHMPIAYYQATAGG